MNTFSVWNQFLETIQEAVWVCWIYATTKCDKHLLFRSRVEDHKVLIEHEC